MDDSRLMEKTAESSRNGDSSEEEFDPEEEEEEVVIKMESEDPLCDEEAAAAAEMFVEGTDVKDGIVDDVDMKVEVTAKAATKEKKPSFHKMYDAFKATESDDAIRNIDVILRTRTMTKVGVCDWMLNHSCCPETYKEKAQTEEGLRVARTLLFGACSALRRTDIRFLKSQETEFSLKFRLAPFEYQPWRELRQPSQAMLEKREKEKKRKEEERLQMAQLRASLEEKEKRLKELRERNELAPSKEFLVDMKKAKKRKEQSLNKMDEHAKQMKNAEDQLAFYAQELTTIRKKRKSQLSMLHYYDTQKAKLAAPLPDVAAAERKRKFLLELLEHENDLLERAKKDRTSLDQELDELEFALDEYRDFARFDATEVLGSKVSTSQEPEDDDEEEEEDEGEEDDDWRTKRKGRKKRKKVQKNAPKNAPLSYKYREDLVKIIMELRDGGVEADSIQTLFESVFECVDFPVVNFPNANVISTLYKKYTTSNETT